MRATTSIQVVGERARFPTATPSGQSVAADGAGGLYLAVGDPDDGARGAAARGDRIALTFGFGIEPTCATDEPSTVIVLEPAR